MPQFVIDAPGGGGKVPINPGYILYHDHEKIVIRNYEGKIFEYPELEMAGPTTPNTWTNICIPEEFRRAGVQESECQGLV